MSTMDNNSWEAQEYDHAIVGCWKDNTKFTKNGLCKKVHLTSVSFRFHATNTSKTFAFLYEEREYRIVSYYNPMDVQSGSVPRASAVPMYASLETEPGMLANAKYLNNRKGRRTEVLLYVVDAVQTGQSHMFHQIGIR